MDPGNLRKLVAADLLLAARGGSLLKWAFNVPNPAKRAAPNSPIQGFQVKLK
jgi:hypothetical protein